MYLVKIYLLLAKNITNTKIVCLIVINIFSEKKIIDKPY